MRGYWVLKYLARMGARDWVIVSQLVNQRLEFWKLPYENPLVRQITSKYNRRVYLWSVLSPKTTWKSLFQLWLGQGKGTFIVVSVTTDSQLRKRDIEDFYDHLSPTFQPWEIDREEEGGAETRQAAIEENS